MKYLIIALLLLSVSCKDDKSTQSIIGKKEKDTIILTDSAAPTLKFKCDEENLCLDSIVLIEDGKEFCQGVVKDGELIAAKECAKDFKCESLVITDINNTEFFCDDISLDHELLKIRTTEDISSQNSEAGILSKDDLTVKAYNLSKVGEQYVQEFTSCSITLSSLKALASTKLNSLFLAIKDCDQLPIGSILFQDNKLVSVSTQSDILNLSQSLVCGDDCDSQEVDKLEFLIDEITAKTKVKHLRKLEKEDNDGDSITKFFLKVSGKEIIGVPSVVCLINDNMTFLNTFSTSNKYNKYEEIIDSKVYITQESYLYNQYDILFFLESDFITHRFTKQTSSLSALSNTDLSEEDDFKVYLKNNSFKYKKIEVPYCRNSRILTF